MGSDEAPRHPDEEDHDRRLHRREVEEVRGQLRAVEGRLRREDRSGRQEGVGEEGEGEGAGEGEGDRKSTRLNSSHSQISYAVFCLKKKKKKNRREFNYTTKQHTHSIDKKDH